MVSVNAQRYRTLIKFTCPVCRSIFSMPKSQASRLRKMAPTCSRKCMGIQSRGIPRPRPKRPMSQRAMSLEKCPECQNHVWIRNCWKRRNEQTFCSRQCAGKSRGRALVLHSHKGRSAWTEKSRESYRKKMTGPRNPAWKGGVTYSRKRGNYKPVKYVRCPAEFQQMARRDGYVMEHRLVMAKLIGRPLMRVEVVHHEDHNPQHNDQFNLLLWPDNRTHKLWEHGSALPAGSCVLLNRCFCPGGDIKPQP